MSAGSNTKPGRLPLSRRSRGARDSATASPPQRRRRGAVKGATRNAAAAPAATRSYLEWVNRALIMAGAAVVLTAAVKAYLFLYSVPVQRITVTGELEHTQAEMVQEMVQGALSGGFLRADLQQMRQQLEGLPWIYRATVRRRWPNALEIHVEEQLPIARWGEHGFLNHEGGVFQPANIGDWQHLPRLAGPPGSAQALMARYQRLVEILAPLELAVQQLEVDDRGQIHAVLAGGIELALGGDQFLARMHRFVAVYRGELAPRREEIERVDLRYHSGVAVAFREPPPQVAGL